MQVLIITVGIVIMLLITIFKYMKWKLTYWERKGLPYIEPEFFFGNVREQTTKQLSFGDQYAKFYNHFKSKGLKHGGVYMFYSPQYLPVDPELIKNILQKDFYHFINHGLLYVNEKVDPLTGNLFNLENEKWRNMRNRMTPAFTSGKMKMMFKTFMACTDGLIDVLQEQINLQDPVDIKDIVARYTTDIIGSCAFGIECNSLKHPESMFRQYGRRIFEMSWFEEMRNLIFFIFPTRILKILKLKQMPKDLENFFINVVRSTIVYRESMQIHRKDFIQLLLEIKNNGQVSEDKEDSDLNGKKSTENPLTLNEMAAQCFVFFLAGFETSATTMTFALLELALNQDIQNKLREEIDTTLDKYYGKISYDAVMEMTYLDKVVHETLRKHPPIPSVPRICNKAYQVPGTLIVLEPGTQVQIPIQAIHRDPAFYPDPEKFDPERFSPENIAKRPQFTFLTFGEGPRTCIGARFGILQTKVGLLTVIRNFRVTLNEKTKLPIKYMTQRFITAVDGGVWLNLSNVIQKQHPFSL